MRLNIVDGANGYVGSNLVYQLLANGNPTIALSRRSEDETRACIVDAVARDGAGPVDTSALKVVPYSLEEPGLGLGRGTLDQIFGTVCDYWHVAALTSFLPGRRDDLARVNVRGTRNTLETVERYSRDGSRYFYLSTAYACGLRTAPAPEDWYADAPPSQFRNFYELSKRQAEILVHQFIADGRINAAVLRLGQVVGSSVSGRTGSPYGIYDFMRVLAKICARRPGERIRIAAGPGASLHLVPVDTSVRWMYAVAEKGIDNAAIPVYHVLDERGIPVDDLAGVIASHLPVDLKIVPREEFKGEPMSHLERVVAARIGYTGNYLFRALQFECDHMRSVIGDQSYPAVSNDVRDLLVGAYLAGQTG
jgi:nucleoside-diphosphate-sugar epimerase